MEFIIDFYKSLDTLNLIIFWGIIIVIILLLIFSFILINKNKKLKSIVAKSNKYEEELPIKKQEKVLEEPQTKEQENIILPEINDEPKEEKNSTQNTSKAIETEKKFVAEEHVIEYNKDLFSLSNIKKANEHKEEKTNYEVNSSSTITMPTAPYQRNVLREMSLSQTSPIGINRQVEKEEKKIEIAKDLEDALNTKQLDAVPEPQNYVNKELTQSKPTEEHVPIKEKKVNNQIKKELTNIENLSPRKTEIRIENTLRNSSLYEQRNIDKEVTKTAITNHRNLSNSELTAINRQPQVTQETTRKTSSEKYLEEVSRKLAEAGIPDEIERTNYELEQEENAIISYKELMEKKDSIQTIDEEEAVISIEELMNLSNQKEEKVNEDIKLYKLDEAEENDNFIKELKQFRKDL